MSIRTTSSQERRELIADSGIRIIARDGLRALTHRAVDQEAGIPQGSTSYHAKTRLALVELIVTALAERAIADAARTADTLDARFSNGHRPSIPELAGTIAALIETLANRRDDMRARYALILELEDAPSLRGKLMRQSEVHAVTRDVTTLLLTRAGLPSSEERVEELIALTDSLLFQRTIIRDLASPESILAAYLRGIARLQHSSDEPA